MCVMVISTAAKLVSILEKLGRIDVSHIYFHNTEAKGLGVPFVSLVPFTNMLVCEDRAMEGADFRTAMLLREAHRMSIPVLSEATLGQTLAHSKTGI
jgi:hypothetical protein